MKGKYAARAGLRREDAEVRSDIETYQQAVKRLTTENKALNDLLAAERSASKQQTRQLKAQLDEGLSPEVIALRKELQRQRERADKAVRETGEFMVRYQRLFRALSAWLHDTTGCTGLEATEQLAGLVLDRKPPVVGPNGAKRPEMSDPERVVTLQRTRGQRSASKNTGQLEALMQAARGDEQ